ncbi:MAG TPA: adenylate/guanylate cyclase domain-containing protein [Baekduia sp.]|uniref:ATP-binding protein n=1 Tax=Baekduia sp. TaxID=2600305 RepID=UPI002CC1A310|nr:adenylate/guanylate cyclase domain-containing protein [Baekduia sp.]HMJ33792.1 adenylate/guanylate cyclase domain-containing protein [Baekduia sp.]
MSAHCLRCGERAPSGARFCPYCGSALEPVTRRQEELRKPVTVLFCDLVDSTALAARLDAESVRKVMSRYFAAMRTALERHGGTVEKFIGDAVMAVFGVPVVHEDHALRAARAATDMCAALRSVNDELLTSYGLELAHRIGIEAGEVVAGDGAGGEHFVHGDVVNVAARMQQAAGAGVILLGPGARRLLGDRVAVEDIAPLRLKGKLEPMPAWRLAGLPAAEAPGAGPPLVGRERELDRLLSIFAQAGERPGSPLVVVLGHAGVGKSRLVEALVERVRPDARVTRGRCLPYGEGLTFWPVVEVVRDAAGVDDADDDAVIRAKISEVVAGERDGRLVAGHVGGLLGIDEPSRSPAETFWAVGRLLAALGRRRPTLVVFDDVHWAETAFHEGLEVMAGAVREAPTVLVCLARPDLRAARPELVGAGGPATVIELDPLDTESTSKVALATLGASSLPPTLVDRVVAVSGGNPLFAQELVRTLIDDGALRGGEPMGELTQIALPPTVHAVLAARLDRLPGSERAIVERASVIGEEFWRTPLVELCPAELRGAVDRGLAGLTDKDLICIALSHPGGNPAFRFGHLLIRDAAYSGILKDVRAQLHERFADWLEDEDTTSQGQSEEIIAHHLQRAHELRAELRPLGPDEDRLAARAAALLQRAGGRALSRGDMTAAAKLLTRAAGLMDPTSVARVALLPDLGKALVEVGEFGAARRVLDEAVVLAAARGQRGIAWRARVGRAELDLWQAALVEDVIGVAEQAVEELASLGDETGLGRAWHVLATCRFQRGSAAQADPAWREAARHARAAGDRRLESEALTWLMISAWIGAPPAREGIRRCEGVMREHPDDRRLQAFGIIEQAPMRAMGGDVPQARALLARGRAMAAEMGMTLAAAGASQEAFVVEMLAGVPERAEADLRDACATLERMGEGSFLVTRLGALAEAVYRQGRYDEAGEIALRARDLSPADDVDAQMRWRAVDAKVRARAGDLDHAEVLMRQTLELSGATDDIHLRAYLNVDLAEILELMGRARDARDTLCCARELFRSKGDVISTRRVEAEIERVAR